MWCGCKVGQSLLDKYTFVWEFVLNKNWLRTVNKSHRGTHYLQCLDFLCLDGGIDDVSEPVLVLFPTAHHAVQDLPHVTLTLYTTGNIESFSSVNGKWREEQGKILTCSRLEQMIEAGQNVLIRVRFFILMDSDRSISIQKDKNILTIYLCGLSNFRPLGIRVFVFLKGTYRIFFNLFQHFQLFQFFQILFIIFNDPDPAVWKLWIRRNSRCRL